MTKQELQTTLGRNLRRIRTEQNLTIEQLAERVGISTTFYSNLECGNKMMSVETLWKLTDALGVGSDALMQGPEPDERQKRIGSLLRDQPEENLVFIERLIRLCVNDLPTPKTIQEGVLARDDAGTI